MLPFIQVLGNVLSVTLNNKKLRGRTFAFGYTTPGFPQHYWHFGWHNSLPWGTPLCIVWCFAASLASLCPLVASSNISPCCDKHKSLQTLPNVQGRGHTKSPSVENHCTTRDCHNIVCYLYRNISNWKRCHIFNLLIANILVILKINLQLLK